MNETVLDRVPRGADSALGPRYTGRTRMFPDAIACNASNAGYTQLHACRDWARGSAVRLVSRSAFMTVSMKTSTCRRISAGETIRVSERS